MLREAGNAAVLSERETVACHICHQPASHRYLEGRGYQIVKCTNDGLVYVDPQPSSAELKQYYSTYDLGNQWRGGEDSFDCAVRHAILHFKSSGSALDIGSGPGGFLNCLKQAGFDVFGIEPSQAGSDYARTTYGIESFPGMVESFLESGTKRTFDVVSILNVLEHLKNPAAVITGLRSLLRQDGILVVCVPDIRLHKLVGELRRKLRYRDPFLLDTERHPFVAIDPPHHLTSFEPRTLRLFLERRGFETVYLRNAPVVFNDDRWKNLAKRMVKISSEALYWLSCRRAVFGYSTLAIARKSH